MRTSLAALTVTALFSLAPVSAQEAVDGTAEEQVETYATDAAAVQRHVDAYRSGNIDRFIATFTPDAVVSFNGITVQGRENLRQAYGPNFAPGAPTVAVIESGMSGPNVYLRSVFRFSDGREICCSYEEFTVRDGKIAKVIGTM